MSDGVRFVHAADLHLGAPFGGVSAEDARIGTALAQATFSAFDRVIDVCLEREARFLVIAGDAYNSADSSLAAQLHFQSGMRRLGRGRYRGLRRARQPRPCQRLVGRAGAAGERARVPHRPRRQVRGRGRRRSRRRRLRSKLRPSGRAREPRAGLRRAKRATRSPSACCTPTSAARPATTRTHPRRSTTCAPRGWTTGRSAISTSRTSCARDPWVVYPGSSQGLNPKETGPHGCMVVELGPGGVIGVEPVETAPIGWAQIDCDVSEAATHRRGRRRSRPRVRRRPSRAEPAVRGARHARRAHARPRRTRSTGPAGRARRQPASRAGGVQPLGVARPRDRHHLGDARPRCHPRRGGVLGGAGQHRRRARRGPDRAAGARSTS